MPTSTELSEPEELGDASLSSDPILDPQTEPEEGHAPKRSWKSLIRRIVVTCVVLLGLLALGIFVLLKLAAVEPEFYQQALRVDQQQQKKNGSEMESKLLNLRNSLIVSETWTVTFTEAQLNGWLAWDLQKKFPNLMPPEASDPRVKLADQSATLAFRCETKPFRGIAIVEADIFMTGIINQIGIRIKSIHSGMVPIPLAAFSDRITKQARQNDLEIEWVTDEGDPVAIIDLPDSLIRPGGDYLEIQELQISKDGIRIAGVTHPQDF